MKNNIPKEATRWYFVMIFCVLLSFFAFAVGPRIGYARETIEHAGLMIALWAPTLGILGVRSIHLLSGIEGRAGHPQPPRW